MYVVFFFFKLKTLFFSVFFSAVKISRKNKKYIAEEEEKEGGEIILTLHSKLLKKCWQHWQPQCVIIGAKIGANLLSSIALVRVSSSISFPFAYNIILK